MDTKLFLPALFFTMKYFFDVEKEITEQLLLTVQLRLMECKDVISGLYQLTLDQR